MFGQIDVDCFTWSTMHGKISLPVAVEIEDSQHDTARHRLFKNPGRYWIAMAHDYPRKTDIDGDELHGRLHTDIPVPLTHASAWRRTLIAIEKSAVRQRRFI